MAEAHSAVAFSFSVTHEGVNLDVNHEALKAVFKSGWRSIKKSLGRIKNQMKNGVYPATPMSWLFVLTFVLAFILAGVDPSFGLIAWLKTHLPWLSTSPPLVAYYGSCLVFATLVWLAKAFIWKYTLRLLLNYHAWMYESRGPLSLKTKLWLGTVKLMGGRKPLLMSYQASLPKLSVPSIQDTMNRYLRSVKPLLDEEKFARMEKLASEFQNGIGNKLQRFLKLKSWWATNYVSDWWEDYVYLSGRTPLMINSNFYGVDAVFINPTSSQASRAANIIYAMLQYRRESEREDLNPILLNKTVPLCSAQYERQFQTTRIPGLEKDKLIHYKDSNHIAVYHKGKYFKVYIYYRGRLLKPVEIEKMIQQILDDDSTPAPGEEHLAALTAGDRVPWYQAREEFFRKGKNRASLDAVEKAAFFVSLDDEPQSYDLRDTAEYDLIPGQQQSSVHTGTLLVWSESGQSLFYNNDPSRLSEFGHSMLHGKGYDRWFDKSFTLVVTSNGRVGFNAEHSWADAPIMGHLWEVATADDRTLGYTEEGNCKGEITTPPPNPIRLEWDLPKPCLRVIENSLEAAKQLIADVDLELLVHNQYGKGFMKVCRVSPDAYIQLGLQLAYYRLNKKFCLTYESSMTRLFREGRTETVRSCTVESCQFVKAMDDRDKTKEERIALMKKAADVHQINCRNAMTGKGIDRHLFCLYVVSKYLEVDSPFLSEVLSEPWRLSTSQTPHQQTNKLDLVRHPEHISAGGGFGPVADDGYGVSYIIAGEDCVFFHISCKNSCPTTSSKKMVNATVQALADIKTLFEH
ncbi:carnitine O-palmitoyltransferase 1, liver isoform-like isoform X2 [Ostrea edulis]|uniref:carnitine O-palmitoyltransferase 1, liver isoform-like isoform X2 n=1 Tax=Ostrea edulis TaxID=37623 RepID=UPI0024AF6171|nr:carnitine O-palmitoyltransferase 1, liver isoform-like isoform X2 [Ostrea edulis]